MKKVDIWAVCKGNGETMDVTIPGTTLSFAANTATLEKSVQDEVEFFYETLHSAGFNIDHLLVLPRPTIMTKVCCGGCGTGCSNDKPKLINIQFEMEE